MRTPNTRPAPCARGLVTALWAAFFVSLLPLPAAIDISDRLKVFSSFGSSTSGPLTGEALEGFFGESVGTNTIHGTVYHDWYGDGGYAFDWGITGVVVELYEDVNGNGLPDDGLPPFRRTATDWWGDFSFTQIPDGDVVIVEIDPAGAVSTNDVQGNRTDNIVALSLAGFQTWTDVLFLDTNVDEKKLKGSVNIDTDGDHILTSDDAPLIGATMKLHVDLDANGVLDPEDVEVDSTTSDSSGKYTFYFVPNGHFIVSTETQDASTGIWDADGSALNGPNAIAVQMTGSNSDGHEFLRAMESISGKVQHDEDGDGDFSDSDPGLRGVPVHLYQDTNNNRHFDPDTDLKIDETVSRRGGNFAFLGVIDGSYLVVEIDPDGAASTNDSDGIALGATGTDSWVAVDVVDGESANRVKFLDTHVTEATIKGKVLNDADGDGDMSDADTVLSGVEVQLYTDPNGDGDPADGMSLDTDTTNLKGIYAFRHVVPGTYVIVEVDPDGATSTNDADGGSEEGGGTVNRIAVTLGASNVTARDFLDTGARVSTIHGLVLNDNDATNDNVVGVEDQGIGGVVIDLFHDDNGNRRLDFGDQPMGTVLSATDGSFVIPNMVEGTYLLQETDPVGAASEFDTDGAPADNIIGMYLQDPQSSGHVFLDDGIDTHAISGSVRSGSSPLFGTTVTLQDDQGDSIDVVQTSLDGSFRFPNLPDGEYRIIETNPSGTTGGGDTDGGDPDLITVFLSGADSSGNDFIDFGISPGKISGGVFDETNWNGFIDADDDPVSGSLIALYEDTDGDGRINPDEPLLATTFTGWDGTYRFTALSEGNYIVTSTNTGGFSVADADGAANGNDTIAVALAPGASSTDNSFLDDGIILRSIRGTVTNGSTPLAGVVINLTTIDGDLIEATATNHAGEYVFPNLPNGSYLVHELDPAGTTGGSDADGPANGDNTIAVTVAFMNVSGLDFIDPVAPQSFHDITGTVRDDTDGDGNTSETSDRPADGLELVLYRDADENGDSDGNEIVAKTRTDKGGRFVFSEVANGNYLIAPLPIGGSRSLPTGTSSGNPGLLAVTVAGADAIDNTLTTAIDPAGYFYDSTTGEILTGGSIEVMSDNFGVPTIVQSGVNGQYSFVVDSADTYTIVVTPPAGFFLDADRPVAAPFYDPTGMPDPDLIGSIEDPAKPGYLVDASAGANQYYLTFDLEPGDPLVLSNNIPLRTQSSRSFTQFLTDHGIPAGPDAQPVADQSGNGGNPDRDTHSNLLEYALTEDPKTGASSNRGGFAIDLVDQAAGRIDAAFSRETGSLDLIYTLQTKDTLTGTWNDLVVIPAGTEAPAPFVVAPNGDGTETLVFPDLANTAGVTPERGFVRLQVALDADQDGSPDTLSDGTPAVDQTQCFGWQCTHFNTSQTASFSHPFSNAPVFSGTVDYVQGAAVNVSTSSNNSDLSQLIGSGGTHYLQVTSGPLEGRRFDIASAAVISLTLVDDPDIFSDTDGVSSLNTTSGLPTDADLAGHSFRVIPHLTVDQLFDKNGAFAGQASGVPSRAAKLFFYNNRSDTPGLESLLLIDLGTEQRWIRSNDFAQLTDQGAMPVDRCAGTYIYPGLGPLTNQFSLGMVADHALAAPFNTGYNLAGSPFPLDQTPTGTNGRAMTVANGFAGGINPTQASELMFWSGDFAADQGATYVQGYDSYMQLDGAGMQRWIDVSDQLLSDMGLSLLLESHRALTVKVPTGVRIEAHIYPVPDQP